LYVEFSKALDLYNYCVYPKVTMCWQLKKPDATFSNISAPGMKKSVQKVRFH